MVRPLFTFPQAKVCSQECSPHFSIQRCNEKRARGKPTNNKQKHSSPQEDSVLWLSGLGHHIKRTCVFTMGVFNHLSFLLRFCQILSFPSERLSVLHSQPMCLHRPLWRMWPKLKLVIRLQWLIQGYTVQSKSMRYKRFCRESLERNFPFRLHYLRPGENLSSKAASGFLWLWGSPLVWAWRQWGGNLSE